MPLFRFSCKSCGQTVELFLSLSELNRGLAACPHCNNKDLEGPLPDEETLSPAPRGLSCSLDKKS